MSATHVAWSSIELLHNVVRTLGHLHEQGRPFPTVEYRAKVKLHGSNCAVQITEAGLAAQSRTSLLTPEADYKGFAAWVRRHEAYFQALPRGLVVFGEWCGPGVEKGMAISAAPTKLFVVFGIQIGGRIAYEPDELRALLPEAGAPAELHVLPWEGAPLRIDYGARASLDAAAAELNARVAEIEREDPWAKRALGISGLGEGLVLYPISVDGAAPPADPEGLAQLMFKAKGEKHRTAGTKTAVAVDAAAVASIDDFVALMVTEARLQQGLAAVGAAAAAGGDAPRDPKLTGKFLEWVVADVRKESVAELEASGLTFAQVEKAIRVRARAWWLSGTAS
ncbi:MAG TPA: RNA ligase family protein [Kofleriaceae bacterium]|nr:RNA ligase family protein [Kofleriaceae bacterium]